MAETLVIQSPQVARGSFKKIRHINYYFQKLNDKANEITPYGLYVYIESPRTIKVLGKGCSFKTSDGTFVPNEITLENLAVGYHIVRFYLTAQSGYISVPAMDIDSFLLIDTLGSNEIINSAKFYMDLNEVGYKQSWSTLGILSSSSKKPMNHEITGSSDDLLRFRIIRVEDSSGVIAFSLNDPNIKEVSKSLEEFTLLGLAYPFVFNFDILKGLPNLRKVDVWGCPNIVASGDISNALNTNNPMSSFRVSMVGNNFSNCYFNISNMPTIINDLFTLNIISHMGVYTSRSYQGAGNVYLLIPSVPAETYDQILIDFANSTSWKGTILNVYRRTSASDEAINTLVARGVNVVVSYK